MLCGGSITADGVFCIFCTYEQKYCIAGLDELAFRQLA